MIYKILSIHRAWEETTSYTSARRPRQMFVTRSRMLVDQTRQTIAQLADSFKLGDLSQQQAVQEAAEDQPGQRAEGVDHPVVGAMSVHRKRLWSELVDEDFPLIVTFDDVCGMLERSFSHGENAYASQRANDEQ